MADNPDALKGLEVTRRSSRTIKPRIITEEEQKKDDEFWANNKLFNMSDDDDEDDDSYEIGNENDPSDEFVSDFSEENEGGGINEGKTTNAANLQLPQSGQGGGISYSKFTLNRENYIYIRPILFHYEIDKECERLSYSYIKIPEDYKKGTINPNCKLGIENVNQTYMGVAPRCPEFYRSPKLGFFNPYDQLLNAIEDEKYLIDTNLIRKKRLLKMLEEIKNISDSQEQKTRLDKLMASNRYIKDKVVKEYESQDTSQRVESLVTDIRAEVAQIMNTREQTHLKYKRKWEIYKRISLKHEEMWNCSRDKTQLGNKAIMDSIVEKYLAMLKTTDKEENPHLTIENFSNLYQGAQNETINALFKSYSASPNSILPVAIKEAKHLDIVSRCYYFVKQAMTDLRAEKQVSELFNTILGKILGFNLKSFEQSINSPVSLEKLMGYVSILSRGPMKVEEAPAQQSDLGISSEKLQDSTATAKKPFGLFLPKVETSGQRAFYGKHYTLFFITLFCELYKRLLFVKEFSAKHVFSKLADFEINETIYELFTQLFLEYQADQIDESTYTICVLNIFGMEGVPLLNMKKILTYIGRNLMSMINDEPTGKVLQRFKNSDQENCSDEKLFQALTEVQDSEKPEPNNTEKDDYAYRFFWDPNTKELFINVFEVKDAITRILKIDEPGRVQTTVTVLKEVTKIEIKRATKTKSPAQVEAQKAGQAETTEGTTDSKKEDKQDLSAIEGPLTKKVHMD